MRFIRSSRYLRDLKRLRLTSVEATAIEMAIAARPEAGDVIVGLNGARKVRFALAGRGKRGGGRAIYFLLIRDDAVALLMAYAKNEKSDLTGADRNVLQAIIEELKHE